MNIKIKNNKNYYEKIKSLVAKGKNKVKTFLNENTIIFYKYFSKLIQNLQFSIMSLLSVHQINIFNFDLNILIFLSKLDVEKQERAVEIIDTMNKTKNYTHIYFDEITFIKEYTAYESKGFEYNSNKTKSITVTPSKIIYNITKCITTNHFQRRLIDYNDNIIKISIVDEDNNNFSYYDINKSPKLVQFIKKLFKDGITLGFYKYDYIGSSNSQLKNLGGWMINLEGIRLYKNPKEINQDNINEINDIPNNNLIIDESQVCYSSNQLYKNCEEIINKFGDFSKEINIFKNTARKGMIFSDTKYVIDVDIHNVTPLKDEKIGQYIITDGIGKISEDLLILSAQKWGITDLTITPISAIQIRFMGCKGVFAVDPNLPAGTIHYRESQEKFQSDDTALNICSVGNYKEGFLNRQFIILLNTLGVEDKIFVKIENDIIKKYSNLLVDPLKYLSKDKSLYYEFRNRLVYFIPTFENFFENKMDFLNEPLFSQFINIFVY